MKPHKPACSIHIFISILVFQGTTGITKQALLPTFEGPPNLH